ncbi:hypothetical protein ACVSQB_02005 [Bradyrhizobium elkanii]
MDNLAKDLMQGVKAISEETGLPERRVFYMAERGMLPGVWKENGRWFGLKSKIREGFVKRAMGAHVE